MKMACTKFSIEHTECRFPVSSMTTREDAYDLAKFLVDTGDIGEAKPNPDNFCELNTIDVCNANLAYRCFALPPVLDRKSVQVDGCAGKDATYVRYRTTQEAIYFYPESTPFDAAVAMASVAVSCGDVEPMRVNGQHWECVVPADIPLDILVEAFQGRQMPAKAYILPRKEVAV